MARNILIRITKAMIALLTIATFVGIVAVDAWWIRVFDFPRLQFAALLVLAMAGLFALCRAKARWWLAVGTVALAFQLYQVFPYSSLADRQAIPAINCVPERRLHLLSLNVLQDNRDYGRTLELVRTEQPDVFLAMEVDAAWIDALTPLEVDYPYSRRIPLDNKYGMALYSRLPLSEVEHLELAGDDTPLIRARVEMGSGLRPTFFAVHPLPPRPGQDSGQRDAELVLLADLVRDSGRPTLVMGDFNDVPWSRVSETFQRVGEMVDPRIGRGFFASFDATNPAMRWPLDHLFHTEDFGVMRFETGQGVGSDHYPLIATLCLQTERFEPLQDAPAYTQEARENAREELESADPAMVDAIPGNE
ncbi:endonuclease/exonuclease/phosphatase family protein [Alteraurantiacibacter aestuarii]|uniref:Endonuclease n=1 Tax=Alteraurantiacibacter aestuarii TaxID=650004 RepID=A0A844ZKQ0_9SPHN|nr:endonuclease/exonuclease/phosphatase family protein [Alteraurantiacibacter aestuarii]MXO88348.1 endonuclease [Alteraurantiacibacter aestuarii]